MVKRKCMHVLTKVYNVSSGFFFRIYDRKTVLTMLLKMPEVAYVPSFYPQGVGVRLIFAQRPAVCEIHADFHNFNIWASTLEFEKKCYKLPMRPLSTPGSQN